MRTIVLDTAALLAGLGPHTAGGAEGVRWVVPPGVRSEVRPGGPTGRAVEAALAAGLQVVAPPTEAREAVEEALRAHGEGGRLSATDREVLALAVAAQAAGDVEIWTDDYAVQNVALALGVRTRPVMTQGIRGAAAWFVRCTGCGRYPDGEATGGTCPVCGSPLKKTRRAPGRRS